MRRHSRLCLGLLVVAATCLAAPGSASAGICSGIGANGLPADAAGTDGSALSSPITDWYQVFGQCAPAYSTVRLQAPSRSITEFWAHSTRCDFSTAAVPNDTLTCVGKDDGRVCVYLKTTSSPVSGMATPVTVTFPDASTFGASPMLGDASAPCSLTTQGGGGGAGSADLEVRLDAKKYPRESLEAFGPKLPKQAVLVVYWATVANNGPNDADNVVLDLALPPGGPPGQALLWGDRSHKNPRGKCTESSKSPLAVTCSFDKIARGQDASASIAYFVYAPGDLDASASAGASTPDPNLANNRASFDLTALWLPDSDIDRLQLITSGKAPTFSGKANSPSVDVALFLRGGANASRGRSPGCSWLKNKRAKFERQAGGKCDRPIWLPTKVIGGKWQLKMASALPPGRYVILSTAYDGKGLVEATFSAKDGNRAQFRVHR